MDRRIKCLLVLIVASITLLLILSKSCGLNAAHPRKLPNLVYVPRPRTEIIKFNLLDRLSLATYAYQRLVEYCDPTDFKEISRRIRLFSELHPISTRPVRSELGKHLERELFGYSLEKYGSISSLAKSFMGGGPGIVLTTGNLYVPFAAHAIRALRMLNCTLPIEIWHYGSGDLSHNNTEFLSSFHGVKVKNVQNSFNITMETWDSKPFAVLASSFDEVILIDADSVFLRDPTFLLDDKKYLEDGALFFNDRSLFPGQWDKSKWILDLFPEPHSERVQKLRMLQGKTQYELESGVVVIDKRRHFIGLLSVGMLNIPGALKDIVREQTHGEKETFWIGLEMANERYSFMPHLPGSLGKVDFNGQDNIHEICGKLLHFDRDGDLLWFNDAIAMSKLEDDSAMAELSEITHFGREAEGYWDSTCFRGGKFHSLEPETKKIIDRLKEIYRFNPRETYQPSPPLEDGIEE